MKILFCKVSCMKYYKGASEKDQPYNGGKFVNENGYGYEEFNFLPILVEEYHDRIFPTKSIALVLLKQKQQIKIEGINCILKKLRVVNYQRKRKMSTMS